MTMQPEPKSIYHIGFTGTRLGMSREQLVNLTEVFQCHLPFYDVVFHHGDCVGADAEAHAIAKALGCKIHLHPPSDDKKRAFCQADYYEVPLPYATRNAAIVDSSRILIAAPSSTQPHNALRSGTWATVRYAQRHQKQVLLVTAQGVVKELAL